MNNSKKAQERHNLIRDMLLEKDLIRIQEFCDTLNVSEATIRNDLTFLEKQHVLKRILGGAVSTEGTPRNTNYHLRSSLYVEEKKQIAKYAVAHYISSGMTIILDAGTTCCYLAQELLKCNISCTVITNSFTVATILEKSMNIQLYMIGGKYDREHSSFYDHTAIAEIKSIYSDLYFLSPNGIDIKGNITSSASGEHEVKQAFIKQANKIIVVGDHSKLGKTALKVLCHLDNIHCIITDQFADIKMVKAFEEKDIDIHLAE